MIVLGSFLIIPLLHNLISVEGIDWDIDETFEDIGDLYYTELELESRGTIHVFVNFTSSNNPTFFLRVIDITNGNNTEIGSGSQKHLTLEISSTRTLNITIEATDNDNYPAPFTLVAHKTITETFTTKEAQWQECFFYSEDYHYFQLLLDEIAIVNIQTIFNLSGSPDIDYLMKAKPADAGSWTNFIDSEYGESALMTITVLPGELWIFRLETIGNPLVYP
ncbi:MAG: hypothetical protein EU542_08690, partial [Promethearchaeota archaeon]